MRYDVQTATFEDDGGPSFDPPVLKGAAEPHPHELHRFEEEGGLPAPFEQVLGD